MSEDHQPSKQGYSNRPHLVAPVRIDESGRFGPTTGQARGPGWRRTSKGFYVPSCVDSESVEQRIVEAARVLPAYGGVTGWAALRWAGATWFNGLGPGGASERPVCLAIGGKDIRPQQGIEVSEERLAPSDLEVMDALRVTSCVRSVFFEMRYAPDVRAAATTLGMAAYDDLVSIAEVAEYASLHPGWTGVPQGRDATGLAHENSWSPQECGLRFVWELDAELPKPLCNAPIFDLHGHHLATPDLLLPELGLIAEYDGALHLQGVQRKRDVRRYELYRALGLECVIVLAGDMNDRPGLAARLIQAANRAERLRPANRRWTEIPPTWWIPTDTVKRRRALSGAQRERLLAYRVA